MKIYIALVLLGIVATVLAVTTTPDNYNHIPKDAYMKAEALALHFAKEVLKGDIPADLDVLIVGGKTRQGLEGGLFGLYLMQVHKIPNVTFYYTIPNRLEVKETFVADFKERLAIILAYANILGMKHHHIKKSEGSALELPSEITTEPDYDAILGAEDGSLKPNKYVFDFVFGNKYLEELVDMIPVSYNLQLLINAGKKNFKIVAIDIFSTRSKLTFDKLMVGPQLIFDVEPINFGMLISMESISPQYAAAKAGIPQANFIHYCLTMTPSNLAGVDFPNWKGIDILPAHVTNSAVSPKLLSFLATGGPVTLVMSKIDPPTQANADIGLLAMSRVYAPIVGS